MGSRVLTLVVVVLMMTLAVTTSALAFPDIETAKPIPGSDYEITDKGYLIAGDVILLKCSTLLRNSEELSEYGFYEGAARACEKAADSASQTKTGGLPVILIPIVFVVVGGLLIRKTIAG